LTREAYFAERAVMLRGVPTRRLMLPTLSAGDHNIRKVIDALLLVAEHLVRDLALGAQALIRLRALGARQLWISRHDAP
jgi:hypothetical protein